MNYLLDTNICSEHMRRPPGLMHRFVQHGGRLNIPAIALAELYAGAYLLPDSSKRLSEIADLLSAMTVLPFGEAESRTFGELRSKLRGKGITVNPMDLLIASTAVANEMTLVTHNVKHFNAIPGLKIEDWLTF